MPRDEAGLPDSRVQWCVHVAGSSASRRECQGRRAPRKKGGRKAAEGGGKRPLVGDGERGAQRVDDLRLGERLRHVRRRPRADRLLGEEGQGFMVAMKTLDHTRPMISASAVGVSRRAPDESGAYAKDRKQFGQPIANFQAIQFMLADMATEIDAARLLARRAAWKQDSGARFTMEASIAKLFASEMATRVTHKAIQVHGGYGYSSEYPVERAYRDARITEIYEGTSAIPRLVIAAWVLKSYS